MRILITIALLVLISSFFACDISVENPTPDPTENPQFANWLIPKNQIINRGTPDDMIPSIDDPKFLTTSKVDFLEDDDLVLGISVNSEFRAYPINILNYHEVVNDAFMNHEIMIAYSPLSGSSAAWDRDDLRGIASTFGISEFIFKSNHILYDRATQSHWLPLTFTCVNGQLEGLNADQYEIIETTWANWKTMFPGTRILSPDAASDFNYDVDIYEDYKKSDTIHFLTQPLDDRLFRKERVHAVIVGERAKVYRFDSFADPVSVVMDNFQGLAIVVVASPSNQYISSFESRIPGGSEIDFTINNDAPNIVMQDNQGNKYDIFGLAVDGPNKGRLLTPTVSMMGYWFAVAAMYPDPIIY